MKYYFSTDLMLRSIHKKCVCYGYAALAVSNNWIECFYHKQGRLCSARAVKMQFYGINRCGQTCCPKVDINNLMRHAQVAGI